MKILLTGGSGLLGTELQKLESSLLAPAHTEFDVEDMAGMDEYLSRNDVSAVIHAAAFTSPPRAESEPMEALSANISGTANVVRLCAKHSLRLVYLSTDYVFEGDQGNYAEEDALKPQNLYAWSKLGGECAVRMYADSLIIRTSFCEPVFPHEKAFVDQYTSRDSVEVIAPMILELSKRGDLTGIIHVGTERKTVKELALQLGKDDVGDLRRDEVSFNVPFDTSLDLSRLQQELKKEEEN